MPLPLLQTKLYLPPARTNLVHRSQLIERLSAEGLRPLTLVSAPAGFGKTTVVVAWLEQMRQGGGNTTSPAHPVTLSPGPAIAWLSLDEDDNDPTRFLTYFITALQNAQPQIGEMALVLLGAPQPPPLKSILTLLLNELNTLTTPLLLALDDYHRITTPAIHEALIFLIDHLPPAFHLIITSRVDPPLPLARWRVRKQLTEIRADDLRFTLDETARFLNDLMHLPLTASQIAKLERRTEGWIAGLQLAVLSLAGRADPASFIEHFTGSHAFIIDYLVEEVLQSQPDSVQYFLLQSSILERLCAPLCDALTGQHNGQAMLEGLQRANLFLIALDDDRKWFRYHHLFSEVLQSRLRHSAGEALAPLHLRASAWYEAAGLLDEAIQHALAAQAVERAAQIVETHSIPLLLRSEVIPIKRWLQLLPAALIEARPHLALVAAWIYMASRQLDQLAHLLHEIPALQAADLTQEMQSQVLILRACLALFRGDFAQAVSDARRSLDFVPRELPSLRASALLILGSGLVQANDWAGAESILQETIVVGKAGSNLYNVMLAYHVLSRFQSGRGDVASALATLNEALQLAEQPGQVIPALGVIYIGLGALWVEPERYQQAMATLQRGEELTKACFQFDILLYGWAAQVKLHLAHGSQAQAMVVVDEAEAWLNQIVLDRTMRQDILQALQNLRSTITQSVLHEPAPEPAIQNPKSKIQNLIEPLSERELEILRLVNAGCSNSEIAEQIIVTVGTVKKHLNNIFGKLGVGSRTQALVRAREVNLL